MNKILLYGRQIVMNDEYWIGKVIFIPVIIVSRVRVLSVK